MTEQALTEQEVAECNLIFVELRACDSGLGYHLDPFNVWLLCGLLQLALKHPDVPAHARVLASNMLRSAVMFFDEAECEQTAAAVRSGPME